MDIDLPHVRRLTDPSKKDLQRALSILHETLSSDTVLMVSTGGSATALNTYLRLLVNGCVKSGALFAAWPSSGSHEFGGVALWGPPCDDWLPCLPREEEEFLSELRQEERDWVTQHAIPRYEELYKSAFGARGYNASISNWQLKAIAVRPEYQRRGLGRALIEAVQQKVTFSQSSLFPWAWNRTMFRVHQQRSSGAGIPFSRLPAPSEMAPNMFPFTVGCSQAMTSNHKVVVDCHSQITVRVPSFAAAFPTSI
ncbi:hypothetical protein BDM02DRAFT_2321535 [Thelephora ganbajun]|uniref:Uncharacterized protein n=1 Tax=Thelephora ganbajun TaxID=370292 RepID=A0ACB6ZFS3_THEGA|nr:hypothetical protein BDM02DRAFT_2321535 [Thelephora ganbajun]